MSTDKEKLIQGTQQLSLALNDQAVDNLLQYLALLRFYNKGANLTSVPAPEMVYKHLLDSLSVASFIKGPRVLDVGTGPGLPGLILASVFKNVQFTLLDSNQKRIDFCRIAKSEIALDNVELVCSRCEKFSTDKPFDQIISRAFAAMKDFWSITAHLRGDHTSLLAMKGEIYEEEMASLEMVDAEVVPLSVPGVGARHLVLLKSA